MQKASPQPLRCRAEKVILSDQGNMDKILCTAGQGQTHLTNERGSIPVKLHFILIAFSNFLFLIFRKNNASEIYKTSQNKRIYSRHKQTVFKSIFYIFLFSLVVLRFELRAL
jgi:hypothetical protein